MSSIVHQSEHRLRIAESVGLLAGACVVGLLLAGLWLGNGELRRVEQTHAMIDGLEEFQFRLVESSAAHASYMITGDGRTLAAAGASFHHADSALRALRVLMDDDSAQHRRLDIVVSSIDTLVALTRQEVTAPQSVARARSIMASPERNVLRARIFTNIAELMNAARAELLRRRAAQHETNQLLIVGALLCICLASALGITTLGLRRRGLEELAQTEANFRRLSADSPDGVVVTRDGVFVYANAAIETLLGLTIGSLMGRRVLDFVPPEDHAGVRQRFDDMLANGHVGPPRVGRMLRADGAEVELEGRSTRIMFGGRFAAQHVLRDLTARRQAERALFESEQRFRAVLDAMDEGVVLHDASMRISLWNPAAERILHVTGDMLGGRTPYDPEWRAVDENEQELPGDLHFAPVALRTRKPATGIMGVSTGSGAPAWIRVNAVPLTHEGEDSPYGVVVSFTDVTSERTAHTRLRDSEARYRLLAENSADLISRWSADFRFTYASPSHVTLLGWAPEEMVGQSASGFMHPDDIERVRSVREQQWAGDIHSVAMGRVRHKDGHWVWLEIAATRLQTVDGADDGYLVSARDVTSRLALEDELRQSQKMEVMGRMASGIAHDFNNLLTVIRASTELMRFEAKESGDALDGLSDIECATDRATALTAHLLTFSRRQHYAPARVQLVPLVSRALPILKRLAGGKVIVDLEVDNAVDAAWIWADPVRFEQVLVNLVSNAKDAMPDGGTVRVACGAATLSESVTHRFGVITPGRYVTLTVEDTGTGMTSDVLGNLFDPFYTTKPQGRGTGLGLSIVYGVVTEAHGTVTVHSEAGVGSRFTVYWPRAEAPVPEAEHNLRITAPRPVIVVQESPPSVQPVAASTLECPVAQQQHWPTVVLVDDDASVRRVIGRQLEAHGFRVHAAASAAEALCVLRGGTFAARAVVTDVRMPEMTGIELVSAMIRDGIDLPVLLISGQLDTQLPREWPEAPHRRFMSKPISGTDLRRAVHEILAAVEDAEVDAR